MKGCLRDCDNMELTVQLSPPHPNPTRFYLCDQGAFLEMSTLETLYCNYAKAFLQGNGTTVNRIPKEIKYTNDFFSSASLQ